MARAIDLDKLLRFLQLGVELAHRLQWDQFVPFTMDDELWLRRRLEGIAERPLVHGWGNADQRADAIVLRAHRESHVRTERKPSCPQFDSWVPRRHEIKRRAKIIHLARPVVPRS